MTQSAVKRWLGSTGEAVSWVWSNLHGKTYGESWCLQQYQLLQHTAISVLAINCFRMCMHVSDRSFVPLGCL